LQVKAGDLVQVDLTFAYGTSLDAVSCRIGWSILADRDTIFCVSISQIILFKLINLHHSILYFVYQFIKTG
jgi:hypothetical protein